MTDSTTSHTLMSQMGVEQFASMVYLYPLRAGLVVYMLLHQIPLSKIQQHNRLQWTYDVHHCLAQWQSVVFSDESFFYFSYNNRPIQVRCYCCERNRRACIVEQYSRQMKSVMIWGTIVYNIRSCLLYIQGNLNSNCQIRVVLEPKLLNLFQESPPSIFQQNNASPCVVRIVQALFIQ